MTRRPVFHILLPLALLASTVSAATIAKLWVFGDSTVKDYTNAQDACSPLLKIAGWGEFIMAYLRSDSLANTKAVIVADSLILDNRANGGRAARTFITGKDSVVLKDAYAKMKPGDYMLIQFGHNDEASCTNYPDRCTSIEDYRKYLGMYVDSVLSKKATPILVTPMARNTWPEVNTHDNSDGASSSQLVGNYPLAMQQVAKAKGVPSVDLTQRSIDAFNAAGQDVTTYGYFRKARSGATLPTGCSALNDGTHFQTAGARAMARQIYLGLRSLRRVTITVKDTNGGTVVGYSNGVKDKANKAWIQLTNDFRNGPGWYENDHNPQVKIEAKPKPGYKFAGWSGDTSGMATTLSLGMARNWQITATFASATAATSAVRGSGIIAVYDPVRRAIVLRNTPGEALQTRVSAIDGRRLLDGCFATTGSGIAEIPVGSASPGLYVVQTRASGAVATNLVTIP